MWYAEEIPPRLRNYAVPLALPLPRWSDLTSTVPPSSSFIHECITIIYSILSDQSINASGSGSGDVVALDGGGSGSGSGERDPYRTRFNRQPSSVLPVLPIRYEADGPCCIRSGGLGSLLWSQSVRPSVCSNCSSHQGVKEPHFMDTRSIGDGHSTYTHLADWPTSNRHQCTLVKHCKRSRRWCGELVEF